MELLQHASEESTSGHLTSHTDESIFLCEGTRRTDYAIASDTRVVEHRHFLHTANQQPELIALTSAFQLAQGLFLKVYRDSKHAFHILLSRVDILKECRLFTTKGEPITNSGQIITMLKASYLPKAICWSHQTKSSIISRGNSQADKAARDAALQGPAQTHLTQYRESILYNPHLHNHPVILEKFCPIYTSSFIPIGRLFLIWSRLSSSPLLMACIS